MKGIFTAFSICINWMLVWSHNDDVHTAWTAMGDCERPKTGLCFLAGTCCELRYVGYNVGVIQWQRNHLSDAGNTHTKTSNCPLKCHIADKDAFTEWRRTPCTRPSTGKCSFNHQCCSMRKGLITSTRECKVPGTCHPSTLKEVEHCDIRCRYDEPDDHLYTEWKEASMCVRPKRGNCAQEGSCCGHPRGTQLFARECKDGHVCWPGNLKRTLRCNIRCYSRDSRMQNDDVSGRRSGSVQGRVKINPNDYTPWERASDCLRPATGDCSFEGMCCGELVGKMNFTRTCKSNQASKCQHIALKRTMNCNVRCNTHAELEVYTTWERISDCERPASGECSAEGSCCNQRKGKLRFKRKCKSDGNCHIDALKKTRECIIQCDSTSESRSTVLNDGQDTNIENDKERHEKAHNDGHDHHDHEDHDHDSMDGENHHSHYNGETHYHKH